LVQPVIVVPGWWVEAKGNYPVKVMNAKYLVGYLVGRPPSPLNGWGFRLRQGFRLRAKRYGGQVGGQDGGQGGGGEAGGPPFVPGATTARQGGAGIWSFEGGSVIRLRPDVRATARRERET
jgi:hypothetical protein